VSSALARGAARVERWDAACIALVLAADYAFKRFCSQASATDLDFLLRPTAALVQLLTGHAFVAERGAGYFSRELLLVIAPACAGHNFSIVLFTALALVFVGRWPGARRKLAWLAASAALAVGAGIVTNSVRIALAVVLREHHVLAGHEAHRALGVAVYLGALFVIFAGTFSALGGHGAKWALPFGIYLAVTLVTPLLGGAHAEGAFWHHAAVVFGATTLAGAMLWLWHSDATAFGRRKKRGVGDTRVPGGVGGARRGGERSLPRQGDTPLVPAALG